MNPRLVEVADPDKVKPDSYQQEEASELSKRQFEAIKHEIRDASQAISYNLQFLSMAQSMCKDFNDLYGYLTTVRPAYEAPREEHEV